MFNRPRSSRSFVRPALLVSATLAACLLPGCGMPGQGKYTKEGSSVAQEKMSMLKSGTEWNMARQQFLGGDLNKALKTVDRSIALNPRVSKSHVLRGRVLLEQSRLEEARASFLQAEQLDPNNVDPQYYLGIMHERVGETDNALARYVKAMDLDSGNPQYLIAATEMLVQAGRLDQAEQLIEQRRQYFQYNAAVRQTMGHIAMLRQQPAQAAQFFSEALLLAPSDPAVLEDLVMAQIESGQFADAEVNIGRLLSTETGKNRRDLKQLRVRCYTALARPVEARTLLIELTTDEEGGRDVRSWIELGNVALTLKDKVNLRQSAARVRAMAPNRPEGYALGAMYARMDQRPEDALKFADEVLARSPHDPSAYILQAMILNDLGKLAEAQVAASKALALDPGNERALQFMGSVASEPSANP